MLGRRQLMGAMGAGAGIALLPSTADAIAGPGRLSGRLGIQLYMVKDDAKRDLVGTLRQLRAIGYREVEAGLEYGNSPTGLRSALDAAGLTCPSIHIGMEPAAPGQFSLSNLDAAIPALRAVGATNAVMPIFPVGMRLAARPDLMARMGDETKMYSVIEEIARSLTADDWVALGKQMNETGSALQKAGIRLGYHNHGFELHRLSGDITALDILIRSTDPKYVSFEFDIAWIAFAGRDPASLITANRGRVTQLHLKDLAAPPTPTDPDMKPADVGEGVIDWKGIIATLRASGIQHAYVEQEGPFTTLPLKAAEKAYRFLQPRLRRSKV